MATTELKPTIVPHDSTRVDISDPAEVRYWCDHFGVFPHELQLAIEQVGDNYKDVDFYFRSNESVRLFWGLG
jgi:hypothetical protein